MYLLGLKHLRQLTKNGNYSLIIEMKNCNGTNFTARYSEFRVSSSSTNYTLTTQGYDGGAGDWDSLKAHNLHQFSTYDRDNDISSNQNCALAYRGGWWYDKCLQVNLNGQFGPCRKGRQYQYWKSLNTLEDGALSATEMKFTLH
ncbi:fibrinogen-like protein A isoform X1 [Ciona intestinalis]